MQLEQSNGRQHKIEGAGEVGARDETTQDRQEQRMENH